MNLAVAARLRFIDCMLEQYGTINRVVLTDYFGLSVPQVSLDIKAYMEAAPANMVYDKTLRAYKRTPEFKRVFP
jgi:hypothetical protein